MPRVPDRPPFPNPILSSPDAIARLEELIEFVESYEQVNLGPEREALAVLAYRAGCFDAIHEIAGDVGLVGIGIRRAQGPQPPPEPIR